MKADKPSKPISRRRHVGFTLIELMISIALVLVLMIGINQVFSYTSKAVGTGQALSSVVRDSRAAQSTMTYDFGNYAADGPLVIRSETQAAFKNRNDRLSDGDANAATYPDAVNTPVPVAITDYRRHRLDLISFCARGTYSRQTGDDNQFTSSITTNEAFITYGHLFLRDNSTNYLNVLRPGVGTESTNPNNFYTSQWVLGRSPILLTAIDNTVGIQDQSGRYVYYLDGNSAQIGGVGSRGTCAPTNSNNGPTPHNYQVGSPGVDAFPFLGRFDLAGTTINGIYRRTDSAVAVLPGWYDGVLNNGCIGYHMGGAVLPPGPVTPANAAYLHSHFLTGCSQFVVEYAGDFLTQNPTTSNVTAVASDGETDYIADTAGRRRIRWYGLPRSPMGKTVIPGVPSATPVTNDLTEVVPARDVITGSGLTIPPVWFERVAPATKSDYASTGAAGLGAADIYLCAWGLDTDNAGIARPKMIRLTYTLDDANGRLSDGQTYEMIFKLQ